MVRCQQCFGKVREKPQKKITPYLYAGGWGLGSRKGVGYIRSIALRLPSRMGPQETSDPSPTLQIRKEAQRSLFTSLHLTKKFSSIVHTFGLEFPFSTRTRTQTHTCVHVHTHTTWDFSCCFPLKLLRYIDWKPDRSHKQPNKYNGSLKLRELINILC